MAAGENGERRTAQRDANPVTCCRSCRDLRRALERARGAGHCPERSQPGRSGHAVARCARWPGRPGGWPSAGSRARRGRPAGQGGNQPGNQGGRNGGADGGGDDFGRAGGGGAWRRMARALSWAVAASWRRVDRTGSSRRCANRASSRASACSSCASSWPMARWPRPMSPHCANWPSGCAAAARIRCRPNTRAW